MPSKHIALSVCCFLASFPEIALAQDFTLLTSWPEANGEVQAIEVDEAAGVLYFSGNFTEVNGVSRGRMAAVDLSSGSLLAWAPMANGNVQDMLVVGDSIIITGGFTEIDGQPRSRLASIDAATGALRPWSPQLNANGFALHIHQGLVYVGGSFSLIDTQPRPLLAAFDPASGELTAFSPFGTGTGVIRAMVSNGPYLIIGGLFNTVGGASRNNSAELDVSTGLATAWEANTNNVVVGLHASPSSILLGGQFTTVDGIARIGMAEVSSADGTLTSWDPQLTAPGGGGRCFARAPGIDFVGGFFTHVGGQPNSHAAALDPSSAALLNSSISASTIVNALAVHAGRVFIGGSFTAVSPGGARFRFAAFSYCVPSSWHADSDEDGFGDPNTVVMACTAPIGFVADNTDCNDNEPLIFGPTTWYIDADGDGFGSPADSTVACEQPSGYAPLPDDCDDSDPNINDANAWYQDADGDGLGDPDVWVIACQGPAGWVEVDTDCDDSDPLVTGPLSWYLDIDGDGFGNPMISTLACTQPAGYASAPTDCDDSDFLLYPGAACDDGDPLTVNDVLLPYPDCSCAGQSLTVSAKLYLQGCYSVFSGLMNDHLREQGLIPLAEPYTGLGYVPAGALSPAGASIEASVLMPASIVLDDIVDWVILELRHPDDGAIRIATRYVLVQRDGDVVDLDGVSPVRFPVPMGNYRLAALHRNHKGVVTAAGAPLDGAFVDFTDPSTAVAFGTSARALLGPVSGLINGDVTFNDVVSYLGLANDRDPILLAIGGSVPTNVVSGIYATTDVNMDGTIKYIGEQNDRDPILAAIGGTVPTNVLSNAYLHSTP